MDCNHCQTDAFAKVIELKAERDQLREQLKTVRREVLEEVRPVLLRCKELFDVALPRFNWGKSMLNGKAIALLNEVPVEVNRALAEGGK